MDLSGAYIPNPTTHVYSDCSGEQYIPLSNSNVPDTNPAPYNSAVILATEDDRLLGLYHSRYDGTNELRNRKTTTVFECPVQQEPLEENVDAQEEEEDAQEEEVTQEEVNHMRAYLMARSPWITRDQVLLYSIHMVNLIWGFVVNSLQYSQKITSGVYAAFQSEVYYFFKDSAHPWDARRINLNRAGSPHVDWFYNADTKTFSRSENDGHLHHFPYLTAEIYHGDLALYDITSFTESLKWTGGDVAPSANHVLSAWALQTGILLDSSLPLVLKVITQEGEESTIPLYSPTAAELAAAST